MVWKQPQLFHAVPSGTSTAVYPAPWAGFQFITNPEHQRWRRPGGSSQTHSGLQSLLALSSTPEVYLAACRACAELSPVPLPLRMEPSAFLPSLLVVPAFPLAPQATSPPNMCSASPKCWGLQGQASCIWWLSRRATGPHNPDSEAKTESTQEAHFFPGC